MNNNEIVIEYFKKNKYKVGFVLTSILSFILILIMFFSEKDIEYIEKEKIVTETVYVNEYGSEVDNPDVTYWYYYYETIDGLLGYGASCSNTKYFKG